MLSVTLVEATYVIAVMVAVLLVLDEDRDPATTLAWLVTLLVLPGVGLVFYFFWGRNWRRIKRHDRVQAEINELATAAVGPTYETYRSEAVELVEAVRSDYVDRLIGVIGALSHTMPLPAQEARIITSGQEMFGLLIEDLVAAEHFIHMQFFIWERDELTAQITEILLDRIAHGVEVRIMYDFVGSLRFSNAELEKLKAAGASVESDLRSLAKLNYRNHLKIVVIDGAIGYTGGMNMGQEYIDGGRRFDTWRDTHLRITGPFVAELQRQFAVGWFESRHESLFDPGYFPAPGTGAAGPMLQLVYSSIDTRWEAVRLTYLLAIAKAEETVRIQSPYFVPDQAVYDALVTAALSGVTVEVMMTGVPDKRLAYWAADSYFQRLLDAGGRVFKYDAGFFHPKALNIDSKVLAIGTTNFDVRSFSLHNELSVFMYDEALALEQERIFARDLLLCHEVTSAEIAGRPILVRLRDSSARLASRLL